MSAMIFSICLISFLFAVDAKKSFANRHDLINFKLSDAQKLQLKEFTNKGYHNDHTKKLTDNNGGKKLVWGLESFFENENCEGQVKELRAYKPICIKYELEDGQIFSHDVRYSETQPDSGCRVDHLMYNSADCTGDVIELESELLSGVCTNELDPNEWYETGESGIFTCHDAYPLEIQGAGLDDIRSNPSDYVVLRHYSSSSTCEESNNNMDDYVKLDQCYTIAANNDVSQNGAIKSAKIIKTNGMLEHKSFIDNTCSQEKENSGMFMNMNVCRSEITEDGEFSMMYQDIMIPNEDVSAPNEAPVEAPNEAEENPCMAGTFQMNGKCTPCNMGTYSIDGATGCDPCLAGTYSTGGLANCLECPKGFFSLAGSVSCELCPAGTYSDMMGSPRCKKCENGMMSAPGAEQCKTCSVP